MKSTSTFISILFVLFATNVFSQVSGNSIIGQNNAYNQYDRAQPVSRIYLSDSSFLIQANILTNVIADNYVGTFGVSESAVTLREANTKIDKRIQEFTAALTKTGIAQSDIYVDMVTQTQICDYKVTGDFAQQYISGFEQKKNVIVKFRNIRDLDKMMILASDNGIYDLAKVDYIVTDINKIYMQLFETAIDVINSKKDLYIKATNMKITTNSEIFLESFSSFYPPQLYKTYAPNITTEYFDYSSYAKKKELKKNSTYYYDKLSYSGFDRVINPIVTEPAVEFVLMLQIKYNIEKSKK